MRSPHLRTSVLSKGLLRPESRFGKAPRPEVLHGGTPSGRMGYPLTDSSIAHWVNGTRFAPISRASRRHRLFLVDQAARTWVLEVLGAKKVVDLRSLAFGITSDLRLIEVDGAQLVLRRYLTNDVIDEIPKVIAYEADALRAARTVLGNLVPEAIAFDVTGAQAGHPSLLMTVLPGRPIVHNLDPRRMAAPLVQLHGAVFRVDYLAIDTGSISTRLRYRGGLRHPQPGQGW